MDTQTNTEQFVQSSLPSTKPLDLGTAVYASMKRMLGANDGYGSPELREIILDCMNGLSRGAELTDGFLDRITATMRELMEEAKKYSRRFTVMRESIIAEESGLRAFVIRLKCP